MKLRDKVAVVTGGGSGIGAEICRKFVEEGARVFALDRDGDAAAATTAPFGASAGAIAVDVSISNDVDQAFAAILDECGRIDVLAHIAGIDDPQAKADIATSTAEGRPMDITSTLSDEQWRRMVSVNLDGTFYCVRAALRPMLAAGAGSIITMSSLAGVVGVAGIPHYSATKAGVLGFTRSVAKEVADRGVRMNAIAPGGIVTPMTGRSPAGMKIGIPLGRLGEVHEIASVALFLASDDASYMTGETLNVNGGMVTV